MGYSYRIYLRSCILLAIPQIVFLDEPSTGMDPVARRLMWNFIMRVVTQGKECAMILTTHRYISLARRADCFFMCQHYLNI